MDDGTATPQRIIKKGGEPAVGPLNFFKDTSYERCYYPTDGNTSTSTEKEAP